MSLKRKQEIESRKIELRSVIQNASGQDLDAAIAELDALDTEVQEIEKRSKTLARIISGQADTAVIEKPVAGGAEERALDASSVEYRSAYYKNLQGKSLDDVEKRALTTVAGSAGAVVPTATMDKVIEKMQTCGKMLPLITQLRIPSNVSMPIEGTTNDADWVSEGSATTDKADTVGLLQLTAYKLIKTISITAELSAMSVSAFEQFIINMLYKKIEKALEYAIINGDGETQAEGIITALEGTDNDVETATADTLTYDDLQDLDALLPEGYEDSAYYIMNKTTLRKRISKIKDDNKQPIYKKETDEKTKKVVDGYPVLLTANVPDDVILLGDPSAYYLNLSKDFIVERDKSVGFRSGDECFRILGLADGKLALTEAFVMLTVKSAPSGS